jgi:hypothetical protein
MITDAGLARLLRRTSTHCPACRVRKSQYVSAGRAVGLAAFGSSPNAMR